MAKILSIDDDPGLQDLLKMVLSKHTVLWAFNGEEGYQKALSHKPDVIILDMMMPVLNGAEVLKLLKAHEALRSIPVIVVTAYFGEVPFTESEIKALGAEEYLRKPVPSEQLAALVDSKLSRS
ncbi:MAG: PleD family two-component system response regulator [Elusimicrobiota bacterium]